MPLIESNSILIGGQLFKVNGGYVTKKRIFPETSYNVQRAENQPQRGDLNPSLQHYEIKDFANGSGLYIDDGFEFSRKAWFSTLNHSTEDLLVIADARQAAGEFPSAINFFIEYNGKVYAGTEEDGLFEFNTTTQTFEATPDSPQQQMTHACIYNSRLWIACGASSEIVIFDIDGSFTDNPGGALAWLVASHDKHIFGVQATDHSTNTIKVIYSPDEGVNWISAIKKPDGSDAGVYSEYDPRAVLVASDAEAIPRLYFSVPHGVWIVDYTTGSAALVYDMSGSPHFSNGRVLFFWGSTQKIYVNERSSITAINPVTLEAEFLGPDKLSTPNLGLPSGLPTGFRGFFSGAVANANYIFMGTEPETADDFSLIMKLSPDGKFFFVQRHYVADKATRALLLSSIGPESGLGSRLYFSEDPTTDEPTARFLDFGGQFAEEGEVHTPWLTQGFKDINKAYYELSLLADSLSDTETIDIFYRLNFDEETNYSFSTVTADEGVPIFRTFGTWPTSVGVEARAIKFVFKLSRDSGSDAVTPRQFNLVLTYRLSPPHIHVYEVDLLLDETSDPRAAYFNAVDALDSIFENPSTTLILNADSSTAVPLVVIPTADARQISFEQFRESHTIKLSFVEIGSSASAQGSSTAEGGNPPNNLRHVHVMESFASGTASVTLTYLPTGPLEVFVGDDYWGLTDQYTLTSRTVTFVTTPGDTVYIHYPKAA